MCLHRRIHIYIFILLSIDRYNGEYNAQDYLYALGILSKNMTAISSNMKVCVLCYVCVPNIDEFAN